MERRLLCMLTGFLLVAACGGGGGESGGGAPPQPQVLSADTAPPTTTATVNLFPFALQTWRRVESAPLAQPTGVSQTVFQSTSSALDEFLQAMLANYRSAQTQPNTVVNCSGGGGITTTTTTGAGTTVAAAYDNCLTNVDTNADGILDASLYRNGSVSFVMSNTLLDYASGLTTRVTRISDGVVLWEEVNTDVNIHVFLGSTRNCGGDPYFASGSLTVNGLRSVRVDSNADGAWDTDQSVNFDNFLLGVSNTTVDSLCRPTGGTYSRGVDLGASVTVTDRVQSMPSWQATVPVNSPTGQFRVAWVTSGSDESLTISGEFSIETSCGRATYSVTTPTPLVVPTANACATAGTIIVGGDHIATVNFSGIGGVQIDWGSDGSIDTTLGSCTAAAVCR